VPVPLVPVPLVPVRCAVPLVPVPLVPVPLVPVPLVPVPLVPIPPLPVAPGLLPPVPVSLLITTSCLPCPATARALSAREPAAYTRARWHVHRGAKEQPTMYVPRCMS
jgi:hypothetical protein